MLTNCHSIVLYSPSSGHAKDFKINELFGYSFEMDVSSIQVERSTRKVWLKCHLNYLF